MNKKEFASRLQVKLSTLPAKEIEDRINFYTEMIDDRIESGMSEEEAVARLGSINLIAAQILNNAPIIKIKSENARQKAPFSKSLLLAIILGSPIWLSLLIALFAVLLSLYVSSLAVSISLWAVFAAFTICAPASVVCGIIFLFTSNVLTGFAAIGAGFVLAGFSILTFYACIAITRGILLLSNRGFKFIRTKIAK